MSRSGAGVRQRAGAAAAWAAAAVNVSRSDALEVTLAQLGGVDLRRLRDVQFEVAGLDSGLPQRDLDVEAALLVSLGDESYDIDSRGGGHFDAALAQRGLGVGHKPTGVLVARPGSDQDAGVGVHELRAVLRAHRHSFPPRGK